MEQALRNSVDVTCVAQVDETTGEPFLPQVQPLAHRQTCPVSRAQRRTRRRRHQLEMLPSETQANAGSHVLQCTKLVETPHQIAKMACALSFLEPNRVQKEVDPTQI